MKKLARDVGTLDFGDRARFPRRTSTDYLVIHCIAEFLAPDDKRDTVQYCTNFLLEAGLSYHYVITPSGTILRLVPRDRIAAHAKGYNSNSIGIALMVPGILTYAKFHEILISGTDYRTPEQAKALAKLLPELMDLYPSAQLIGHDELDPNRKVDPGAYLPMDQLRQAAEDGWTTWPFTREETDV